MDLVGEAEKGLGNDDGWLRIRCQRRILDCSTGVLMTLGPSSSAKNVVEFDVVTEESTQLSFTCMHKLVRIGREQDDKLSSDLHPRLLLLGSMPRAPPPRVCTLGSASSGLHLEFAMGALHKGLVEVWVSDVAPSTIKLVPRSK
ncbi:hypothetical protein BHE74_00037438 [Ensete ventricosum]|nr:hypothetical protein GW17_00037123 [Ensete ventricosum]RWW55881.1 hypothetical protein BHE74_00037438 [Ensete ventricosum]